MTGDDDEAPSANGASARPTRLQAVHGPLQGLEPPPSVHLWREFKGLTVADLLRDELVAKLPGQMRSALADIERGDYGAADRRMPGSYAPLLPGPVPARSPRHVAIAVMVVAAIVAAFVLAQWLPA